MKRSLLGGVVATLTLLTLNECGVSAQRVASHAGSEVICPGEGDFEAGESIVHKTRGVARVACATKYQGIGICQGPFSGHDKFYQCVGGRPDFCTQKSLWFSRCADVRRESSFLQDSRPLTHSSLPGGQQGCGCSWNFEQGCQVSGQQTLNALQDAEQGSSWCSDPESDECKLVHELADMAEDFRHCFTFASARRCSQDILCQWSAQAADQCGFDEEQFMLRLIGNAHRNHPMVRMIMYHDHCGQLGVERCDADPLCQSKSDHAGYSKSCDVAPMLVTTIMVANPRLLLEWEAASRDALCHARATRDGHTSMTLCPRECEPFGGTCRANRGQMTVPQLEGAMNALCRSSHLDREAGPGACPRPCIEPEPLDCRAPPVNMSILWRQDEQDDSRRVIGVLKVTQSALMVYEQQCSSMHNLDCKLAVPFCGGSHNLSSQASDFLSADPSKASLPTLGFKGVLHNAAQAVAAGKGKDFMEDFLSNHPETIKQLTGTLADRIKTLWKPVTTTPAPTTTSAMPASVLWTKEAETFCESSALIMLAPGSSLQDCQSRCATGCRGVYVSSSVYVNPRVDCHVCRGDPNVQAARWYDFYRKVTPTVSPSSGATIGALRAPIGGPIAFGVPIALWLIAGAGVCVAIICSGIAFGVCCHAQMTSRSRRREMGGALLAADRDMDVFAGEALTGAMPI